MSAPIEQGDTYTPRLTVTDSSGAPVNAGSVTVTITLPDGTTTSPAAVNAGTGLYDVDYATTQVGRHTLISVATGGGLGSATQKYDDVFHVEPPGRFLVGFDDAVTQLRGKLTITTLDDREQLRWLCVVASDAVERDLDLVVAQRVVVETHNGGRYSLELRQHPVIAVQTVVEDGTTLSNGGDDYIFDDELELLYRGGQRSLSCWSWGRRNVVVTYLAGMLSTPAVLRQVALYLIQSLWQSSQQAPHTMLDESQLEDATLAAVGLLAGLPKPLQRAYNQLRNKA